MTEQEHFETDADYELLGLGGGFLLKTHAENVCGPTRYPCCIHNPSDHALRDAPMIWRADRGLMERRCVHGVGHPDPDDLAFKRRTLGEDEAWGHGIHGCCAQRCCYTLDAEVVEERKEIGSA